MSAPSLVKNVGLKSVEALANQWQIPESVIVRECRDLLLLPVEAAEARMCEEPPVSPRTRKGAARE